MNFNSPTFLFVFLPAAILLYFYFLHIKNIFLAKTTLISASLFFYASSNISYLPLLLISILVNFYLGKFLLTATKYRLEILLSGITFNLGLLVYFKYFDFLINNINSFTHSNFSTLNILLPLAISFFTFQQLAYIIDCYRKEAAKYKFIDYSLFITFFPHLVMGPIVYHAHLIPQFNNPENFRIKIENISAGLFLFAIGLFKKVVMADNLGGYATSGFSSPETITFIGAWLSSYAFSFQLYFDYSGYTDMAIGIALMFNIKFPINFFSPLRSINIAQFWERWNITLIDFFRRYIYIPLGGNRHGLWSTYRNLFIIFFLTGIWHGAGWNFIIWGVLHALVSIGFREWRRLNLQMPTWLAFLLTINYLNLASIIFRVHSIDDIVNFLRGLAGLNGFYPGQSLSGALSELNGDPLFIFVFLASISICFFMKTNSVQWLEKFSMNFKTGLFTMLVIILSILMDFSGSNGFIYYQF
jgi:alginate O-acetyltransferase complex protein AlgI